ncbi:MAG: hypothetical protein JW929_11105 [Anaerolineales bacterium]|nr:hypothetical protein [Anaerolineales bacterium]
MNPSPAFYPLAISIVVVAVCLVLMILRLIGPNRMNRSTYVASVDFRNKTPRALLGFLVLYGILAAAYFILRYHGQWAETDSASHTQSIEYIKEQGVLIPERGYYLHGFSYQLISLAIMFFTGLSAPILQTQIYSYVASIILVITTFTFFREVIKQPFPAVLASVLVFFQPEFLFITMRGSHEKFTWPLMMLALTVLYRSIGQPLRKMTIYVIFFYGIVFAMIATNIFFGSVFLAAIVLSMVMGVGILRIVRLQRPPLPFSDIRRLMLISLSGGILIYIFMAYIYPPALSNLRELRSITDQLSALLLSFEIKAQPYAYISFGWISTEVYFGLTVFTWLLILASILEWIRRAWRIFHGEARPGLVENIDWMLYTGFVIQIILSIAVDFSGALAANMQLRLFPGFTVLASALLTRAITEGLPRLHLSNHKRWVMHGIIGLMVAWFTLASLFKATNETLLSNKWGFYTESEYRSIEWVESRLRGMMIWSGIDERLSNLYRLYFISASQTGNILYNGDFRTVSRYIIYSENDKRRERRLGIPSLPVDYWDQIYDNGEVVIYHQTLFPEESP